MSETDYRRYAIDLRDTLGYEEATVECAEWSKEPTGNGSLTVFLEAGREVPAFGSPHVNHMSGEHVTMEKLARPFLSHPHITRVIAANRFGSGQRNLKTRSIEKGAPDRNLATLIAERRAFFDAIGIGDYINVSHSAASTIATGLAFAQEKTDRHVMKGAVFIDPVPLNLDVIGSWRARTLLLILKTRIGLLNKIRRCNYEFPGERTKGLREIRQRAESDGHGFPDIPVSVIHATSSRNSIRHLLCRSLLSLEDIKDEQRKFLGLVPPELGKFFVSDESHNVHHDDIDTVLEAATWVADRVQ